MRRPAENEMYIRDAFHAFFNTCRPPYGELSAEVYRELCRTFVRIRMDSFAEAGRSRDKYGNIVFFLDEFLSSARIILADAGLNVGFSCSQEDIFCNCGFDYLYYICAVMMRSVMESGGTSADFGLFKIGNSVCLVFTSDRRVGGEALFYVKNFAELYSGSVFYSCGSGIFQLGIKISPGSQPGDDIALYDTDFLFDCTSPVYIGLGIMMK